jgi:N-acetylglutamate synthase-like GNAT family acetyltransferase
MKGFTISSDPEQQDFDVIYGFLSQSYWAKGIPKEVLRKAIKHSLCFGIFSNTGQQVGFARFITDRATFAYLADVFIVEEYRGLGLSKCLIQTMVDHPELQGLRRVMLATKDAHGLYQQYGFTQIAEPEMLMQKWQPNVYQ